MITIQVRTLASFLGEPTLSCGESARVPTGTGSSFSTASKAAQEPRQVFCSESGQPRYLEKGDEGWVPGLELIFSFSC